MTQADKAVTKLLLALAILVVPAIAFSITLTPMVSRLCE
jgi:hypothetical protein